LLKRYFSGYAQEKKRKEKDILRKSEKKKLKEIIIHYVINFVDLGNRDLVLKFQKLIRELGLENI